MVENGASNPVRYRLTLYISGGGPDSRRAIENAQAICGTYLRGMAELEVIDVLEHPEQVHAGLRQLADLYFEVFDGLYELIEPATPGGGCSSHYQVWAPGKLAKVQCDLGQAVGAQQVVVIHQGDVFAMGQFGRGIGGDADVPVLGTSDDSDPGIASGQLA